MTIIAIRALGLLHGIFGLYVIVAASRLPAMPDADAIPRTRIFYVASKCAFAGFALVACAFAAWERPSIAWLFAALSLLSYLPAPRWARFTSPTRARLQPIVSMIMSARVVGIVLLAIAGNSLDA
jgi:hypothetical protein